MRLFKGPITFWFYTSANGFTDCLLGVPKIHKFLGSDKGLTDVVKLVQLKAY